MTDGRMVRAEVHHQRVTFLYRKAPIALAAVVVNAALLAWYFDGVVARSTVAQWCVFIGVVTIARVAIHVSYKTRRDPFSPGLWERLHTFGSLLNGLAWSMAGGLFVGTDLAGDVALVFVVGGLVAGASSSSATSMRSFLAFSAPPVLTIATQLLMVGQRVHVVMAVMLLLFGIAMTMLARENGEVMATSYQLRYEHDHLTEELGRRSRDRAVRLQMLLDHSGVAFIVAEPRTGKIVDANKSAEELFDLGPNGRERTRVYELGRVPFLENADAWNAFVAQTRGGVTTTEHSYRGTAERRTLEVVSTQKLIHDVAFILIVLKDVTEQKALEVQLTRASLLASLGTMSAGVAHEVNNPLSFILSNLEYLQEELTTGTTEKGGAVSESIDDAIGGVQRIRRIVRDLLTTARSSEAGAEAIDVKTVIETCVNLAEVELRHRALVVVEVETDQTLVRSDSSRMTQVFLNLLLNAARSIPEGHAEDHRIDVVIRRDADEPVLIVDIRDTGRGIDSGDLPRIFEPFFTTRPPGEGTGLGLSICYAIVSDLGGTITAESTIGKGSCFSVRLPATDGVSVTTKHDSTPVPLIEGRILIVDDDVRVARGTARQLMGCDVHVETDAATALQRIERGESFDVVVCDLMMPRMDGVAFYEAVRALDAALSDRFIFLTGGALTKRTREFITAVQNATIMKPIETDQLRSEIRAAAKRSVVTDAE